MKKFMRIALVFALAGATLVGCTKDYSGDISDLNKKVTEQASALSALQTQVGAAQTAADAAAQKAAEALAEAQKKASSADVQAAEERVNAKISDLVNGDVKALQDAVAALEGIKADERLTALETAIKDFVTKAEFAQELASLKDELTAAIAAGDKANADAIAALEKKVEDILAQTTQLVSLDLLYPRKINVGYAKFNGVFENVKGVWTASTWKGSREVPAKGTLVSSINNGKIYFKANPTDCVLVGEDLEIINAKGVAAPFVFSNPIASTTLPNKVKASAGLYESTYNTLPGLDEDAIKKYQKEFPKNTPVALAVKNIVSDFGGTNVTFKQTEKSDYATFAFDCYAIDNDGAPELGVVDINKTMPETITVVPATNEAALYDAYICGIGTGTTKADSIKFGLSFDGMTFSYDAEAVKEYIIATAGKDEAGAKSFTVKIAQINNCGYVDKNATATVTFKQYEKAAPEVVEHEEFVLSTAAAYQAKVLKSTTWGEKVTVDITEALKEWGLDDVNSKARILWDATTRTYSVVEAYSYAANDPNVTIDQSDLFKVANFGVNPTTKAPEVTITFDEKYGTPNSEFDPIVKGGKVYVKVALVNATDAYYVVVPVQISAIKPSEYFTWNGTNNYADGVLTIYEGTTHEFDLNDAFKPADGVAVTLNNNTFNSKTGVAAITIGGHSTHEFDKWLKENPSAKPTDAAYVVAYDSKYVPAIQQISMHNTQYQKKTVEGKAVYNFYRYSQGDALAKIWWDTTIATENYNRTMTVNGLSVSIYDREFALAALNFQIFKEVVTFSTDPAEIVVSSTESAAFYNAALAPSYGQASQFAGSFSLRYNGKALEFYGSNLNTDVKVEIAVLDETTGEYEPATAPLEGIAGISFTSYTSGWNRTAYGFEITPDGTRYTAGKTYKARLTLTSRTSTDFVKYLDNNTSVGLNKLEVDLTVTVKD